MCSSSVNERMPEIASHASAENRRTEQSAPETLPVFGQSVLLVSLISVHFLSLGKAALEGGLCSLCVLIPIPDMAITAGHVCETLWTPKS